MGVLRAIAVVVLSVPCRAHGQDPAVVPSQLVAEFRLASLEAEPIQVLETTLREMTARPPDDPAAPRMATIRKILPHVAGTLPWRGRVFVPSQGDLLDPAVTALAVLDAVAPLPIGEIRALFGSGWWFGTLARAEGVRYVFARSPNSDPTREPWFLAPPDEPGLGIARKRLWQRVCRAPNFVFVDACAFRSWPGLPEATRSLGSNGLVLGWTCSGGAEHWACELHCGLTPGSGVFGALLPKTSQPRRWQHLLPWEPGVVFEGNVGLAAIAELRARYGGEFLQFLNGTFGMYAPEVLPETRTVQDLFRYRGCILAEVREGEAADLLALVGSKPGSKPVAKDPETGALVLSGDNTEVRIAARGNLIVVNLGGPQLAKSDQAAILARLAERTSTPASAPEASAQIRYRVSGRTLGLAELEQAVVRIAGTAGDLHAVLGRCVTALAASLRHTGFEASISWDSTGAQLRIAR